MDYVMYLLVATSTAVVLVTVFGWCVLRFIALLDRSKVQEARPHVIKAMVWLALSMVLVEVASVGLAATDYVPSPDLSASEVGLLLLMALPSCITVLLSVHYLNACPSVVAPYLGRVIRRWRGLPAPDGDS